VSGAGQKGGEKIHKKNAWRKSQAYLVTENPESHRKIAKRREPTMASKKEK